jgi:protein-tyrosine-phosphatase
METTDQPRLVATSNDSEFVLTIDDALALYAAAGIPRTPRSIQRYCAKQHLFSRRIETEFGEKYLITLASVEKHIAYIKEVTPATSRGTSRLVATTVAPENKNDMRRQEVPTTADPSRPVATTPPEDTRYVAALERENEFLRAQIDVKDKQIAEGTERARETNHLVAGLQNLLRPLLTKSDERRGDASEETLRTDSPHL